MNHPIYGTFRNFWKHFFYPCIDYILRFDYSDNSHYENIRDHIFKEPFKSHGWLLKVDITEHHLKLMRHPLFSPSHVGGVADLWINHKGPILEKHYGSNKIIKNAYKNSILAFYNNRWYLCKSEELLLYHMLTQ